MVLQVTGLRAAARANVALAGALVGAALLVACATPGGGGPTDVAPGGAADVAQDMAPDGVPLALRDMDGSPQDVDAALARGETVALVFWQTWCASCRREAPLVAAAARRHGDAIRFLGVVPGRDGTVDDADVRAAAAEQGYPFAQVRDRDLSLSAGLSVDGTPTIVVLGRGRQVLYRGHRPPADWAPLRGAALAAGPGSESHTLLAAPAPGGRGVDAGCHDGVCPVTSS